LLLRSPPSFVKKSAAFAAIIIYEFTRFVRPHQLLAPLGCEAVKAWTKWKGQIVLILMVLAVVPSGALERAPNALSGDRGHVSKLLAHVRMNRETPSMLSLGWTNDVLKFWFDEAGSDRWFGRDSTFDDTVRRRFRAVHEALAICDNDLLLVDAQTALAAVIVLDQMSRNMFRDTPSAFATDRRALSIAQDAIASGFDVGLSKD